MKEWNSEGLGDLSKVTAIVYGDPGHSASGTVSVPLAQEVSRGVPPCSDLRMLLPLESSSNPSRPPRMSLLCDRCRRLYLSLDFCYLFYVPAVPKWIDLG